MKEDFIFSKSNEELIAAIPCNENGKISGHFGHSKKIKFLKINKSSKKINEEKIVTPPPHKPGVIPIWVAKMGTDVIFSSGMGEKAQHLFNINGIEVFIGIGDMETKLLIDNYLNGTLKSSGNACSHH